MSVTREGDGLTIRTKFEFLKGRPSPGLRPTSPRSQGEVTAG